MSDRVPLSLREKQKMLIQQILNLNRPVDDTKKSSLEWKVLIYDKRGYEILYTLINMDKLHEVGITFMGDINSKHEHIDDVSAVYFIQPTQQNFEQIAKDCASAVYDKIYINFISPIDRQLQPFAEMVAQMSDGRCIQSVFDQFVDFSSPDSGLVELYQKRSMLYPIYGLHTKDDDALRALEDYSLSLLSVFLTAGENPRVFYTPDLAADHVAHNFETLVQPKKQMPDLWDRLKLPAAVRSNSSPVLLLIDRNSDYASLLHHPSGYQAFVDDAFHINHGEVVIGGNKYVLDTDHDEFWEKNRLLSLDEANKAIGAHGKSFGQSMSAIASNVSSAMDNYHELQRQKLSVATHTAILKALMDRVQATKHTKLYDIEASCFFGESMNVDEMIATFAEVPNKIERLRTAVIAYICNKIPADKLDAVKAAVDLDMSFLDYVPKYQPKSKSLLSFVPILGRSGEKEVYTNVPIVQTVQRLLDGDMMNFKALNTRDTDIRQSNLYVFVVGPGSYLEYQGLMALASAKGINITYGCTSMMSPNDFAEELRHIAD